MMKPAKVTPVSTRAVYVRSTPADDAQDRADRAKRYAKKFPDSISPSDLVFQDPEWQLAQIMNSPSKQKEDPLTISG